MQLYDIPTNVWTSTTTIPLPLNHQNAAVGYGKIFLLGGLAVAPDGAWRAVPDSWVYDPHKHIWSSITPMPNGTARRSAAMGTCGSKVYLAGGMAILDVPNGGHQDSVDTVLIFDTITYTWHTPHGRLHEGRDHAGAAAVDDKI
ncbi:hypothetical protein FSARC_11992 [Fusarium sarcochroum]|uniref:Galactose oxidase n=1 Tax=Fusarium sarcochroum TaxID=1208366 RepID=A0A8H4TBP4_9HYPO|nr:hypothetical protein FSARC_11992 [Fusarium sarcochroum]